MRKSSFKEQCSDVSSSTENHEIPKGRESNLFPVLSLDSGERTYYLEQEHSNFYVVFDYDGTGIIHIRDNLEVGTAILSANVGTGAVEVVMEGLETLRGIPALQDVDGFITLVKIAPTVWQSSERGA